MSDMPEANCYCTNSKKYFVGRPDDCPYCKLEAAERTAAELRAQLATVTAQLESVTVQRDAAEAWLQVAQARIKDLESYLEAMHKEVEP